MLRLPLFVLCLAAWNATAGEAGPFVRTYSTNEVSVAAGFIPDASVVIVGEPLFISFAVTNQGSKPFEFCRVNTEIFDFKATNAAGTATKETYLHTFDGNGPVSRITVAPGEAFTQRLFLNRWCRFDQPGDYTVTCRGSLGRCFETSSVISLPQPIITVFKLKVLPPDPARVTELISQWGEVVKTNGPLKEAAQALAELNDPRTIQPLAALVEKNPNDHVSVSALSKFTNTAAMDALALVLKSGEDFTAGVAREAIAKSQQGDRIARSFLPGLANADSNVRIQNARALGWTGSGLAFAPLCDLLQDETNTVRYAAAQSLGRLGDTRSVSVLTNLLNDPDLQLRLAAVRGLIALNRPFQAEWVAPIIRAGRDNKANFRSYHDALVLTSIFGGNQAALTLVNCLDFENPSVRASYNFYLLQYIGAKWNPPYFHYYKWHHDPNRDGTEEELASNRRILSDLQGWLQKQNQK